MAVNSGHFKIVQKLVQKGASLYPVNIGIIEIIENNPSIARFLIENRTYDRIRVLRSAVKSGNPPIVKLLLERGENPNTSEDKNITLLHQAVKNGHLKIVQSLIKHGANGQAKSNDLKETPLHYAVKYSSEEMIKELLKNKVQIDSLDKDHCTPLWLAASSGKKEIVKVLIDAGADVDIQDNLKRKPLAIAIKNGHNDIAKIITDKLQEQNENLEPLSRRIKISDDCAVCFGPRHNVFAFQPCGHTEICEICCIRIFQEPNGNSTCPICRTRATNYMKIFV
jgi:ankyrin repeat protein